MGRHHHLDANEIPQMSTLPKTKPSPKALSGEQDFVAEMARARLVEWADRQVRRVVPVITLEDQGTTYLEHAAVKGWVTARHDGVTAAGFKVAAAYLRR